MKPLIALALVLLLASASPISAQETTGNLQGQILDEAGNFIPYANVVASGPSLQGNRGVMCHEDGRFRVLELPVGVYTIKISHISFQAVTIENVRVHLGRTTGLGRIELAERIHEMEEIVITAERPLIDPVTSHLGINLTADEYSTLPIDRSFDGVATLLPHANESIFADGVNFAGATGAENRFFIDGVDVTDPYMGTSGTRLPHNFVEEVQVRTGGYEAEHRSSLGGVVNVVTYSGGNDFGGQVFGFFVSDRLTAESRTGLDEPEPGSFVNYDLGGSVGGPLAPDRLWFHAAYNPSFEREDVFTPGPGYLEDRSTTHAFATKLTWQATERNNFALSVFGDPRSRDQVAIGRVGISDSLESPDPVLRTVENWGLSTSLRGRHLVSDRVLLRSSASVVFRRDRALPKSGERDRLWFRGSDGVISGGPGDWWDDSNVQTTVEIDGTLLADEHTLKAGLVYRESRLEIDNGYNQMYQEADGTYSWSLYSVAATIRNRIPSAFLQDSWRIGDRFTLNGGLRWDGQFLVGSDGEVAQKFTDQWQPRLGFVLQLGEQDSQRVHGSYGRFYQELNLNAPAHVYVGAGAGAGFWSIYDHDPREDPSNPTEVISVSPRLQQELDLEGQHYDEFTLGYERKVAASSKVAVRGIYRTLRQALEDGMDPDTGEWWFGNPGHGPLSAFPEAEREYRALEVSFQRSPGAGSSLFASYVLARNRGNYPGLFNSDWEFVYPNYGPSFDLVEWVENSNGLLPNDRTHVFKLAASQRVGFGVTGGASLVWESGRPISELRRGDWGPEFVSDRGSYGRMPSVWDLNLRFTYDLQTRASRGYEPRFTLDLLHVASQREGLDCDEIRYEYDGSDNRTFMRPTKYQPPMAVRFGLEVDF